MSYFFWGVAGIAFGFWIIVKAKPIKDFLGDISWAERHIGTGGSYTLIKIIGLVVIAFSFAYMTGTLGDFVTMLGIKRFLLVNDK